MARGIAKALAVACQPVLSLGARGSQQAPRRVPKLPGISYEGLGQSTFGFAHKVAVPSFNIQPSMLTFVFEGVPLNRS